MNDEDLLNLLRARRSVRRFAPNPPSRAQIERLIEAAITAPSANNKQPWRFVVVETRECIERMAQAVREATARIVAAMPEENRPALAAYGDYFTRFENAPTVLVPLHRSTTAFSFLVDPSIETSLKQAIERMEHESSLISASLALANLLLMAHTLGLGASAMTGPLVAEPTLRTLLEVPQGWDLVAVVPLGFPAELPTPTTRKPVDAVIRWR